MEHWAVPSKTENLDHVVMRREDGGFVCDCPGYLFRGKCSHIQSVVQMIDAGIEYLGDW